jgi:hypothetical protein
MIFPHRIAWNRNNLPPRDRIEIACQFLDAAESRLFACWCLQQIWNLLVDKRSQDAVDIAEQYALGKANDQALAMAHAQAREVIQTAKPVYMTWAHPKWKTLMEHAARRLAVDVTEPFTPHLALTVSGGSIMALIPDRLASRIARHPGWRMQAVHLQETYHVVEDALVRRG